MTAPACVNRRKTKLVNWNAQSAFTFRLIVHSMLVIWVVGMSFVAMQFLFGPLDDPQAWNQFMHVSLLSLGLATAAILPVLTWDAFTFSHRFAGPVVRLTNVLKLVQRGETAPRIKLRKKDFWLEVADEFNQMLDRLEVAAPAASPSTTAPDADPAREEPCHA